MSPAVKQEAALTRVGQRAAIGCAVIVALGWFSLQFAPATWNYSWLQWRVAPDLRRQNMAHDYLRAHWVKGMSFDRLLNDLGEPTEVIDYWSYAVTPEGLGEKLVYATPQHRQKPILYVWFDKERRVEYLSAESVTKPTTPGQFQRDGWMSLRESDRQAMAWELMNGNPGLVGAHKDVVRAELGEPDSAVDVMEIAYHVAPGGSDRVRLLFYVDESDAVVDAAMD